MENPRKFTLSLPLVIVSLIVIISVGVYLGVVIYQSNQIEGSATNTTSSETSNTPTPSNSSEIFNSSNSSDSSTTLSSVPSDWQTYTNSEVDFTFKYPKEWYIYGDKGQKRINIQTQEGDVTKATMEDDFMRVWISYSSSDSSELKETETQNISGVSRSTITSGNLNITIYEWGTDSIPSAKAYWTDGTTRYSAKIASETGTEKGEISILKQILSTFKFTSN